MYCMSVWLIGVCLCIRVVWLYVFHSCCVWCRVSFKLDMLDCMFMYSKSLKIVCRLENHSYVVSKSSTVLEDSHCTRGQSEDRWWKVRTVWGQLAELIRTVILKIWSTLNYSEFYFVRTTFSILIIISRIYVNYIHINDYFITFSSSNQ